MKATVYHAAGDVRLENVADPVLRKPTDALVRVLRAAICGSDLWFYRGVTKWEPGMRTGHEFVGVIEEVGSDVLDFKPGDYVIAPFVISDGTCEFCKAGLQTSCLHGEGWGDDANGAQAQAVRVPLADGTLVKMLAEVAGDARKLASATALTDVMATGHHGVLTAGTHAGGTVAIIGDGAVGLCGVLAAGRLGAERIISIGHNPKRLEIARSFGAGYLFNSHDADIAEQVRELTKGGSASVLEAVGNQESLDLAIGIARPGGAVTFVGVPHNVKQINMRTLFTENVSLRGAVTPARAYIPELLADVENGSLDPSAVFDLELPLDRVAEGYAAMDERKAVKVLLTAG